MSYYGDFLLGATVRIGFNTVNASAVPTALSGGTIVIRKDGANVTPSGGVTLNVTVDSNAGQNELVITLGTDAATFTAGHDYKAFLGTGSNVGGTSVVGIYLGEWSIQNRPLDLSTTTPALRQQIGHGYPVSTGVTTPVSAATDWAISGTYLGVDYYFSVSVSLYAWTDGTFWYISSTAPGVSLPSGYWKTATGATVTGPYIVQGGSPPTGVPAVVYRGNSVLATFQPNQTIATPAAIATQVATTLGLPVVDGGTVSASPTPTTTTFTATGALHAPTGGYTIAPQAVYWQTGANQGIKSGVTGHTVSGSNHAFAVTALPAAPSTGDTFIII